MNTPNPVSYTVGSSVQLKWYIHDETRIGPSATYIVTRDSGEFVAAGTWTYNGFPVTLTCSGDSVDFDTEHTLHQYRLNVTDGLD
jgi:hypothetical protein